MTSLEAVVRTQWIGWGAYAKHTACHVCGSFVYCRAKRQAGPWLCLDCFDQR